MAGLEGKECVPCQGGTPPLAEDQISNLLSEIDEGWSAIDNHHISREWEFPDFETALAFTNKLGAICEEQNHHADFELGWGRVQEVWWNIPGSNITRIMIRMTTTRPIAILPVGDFQ